MAAEARRTVDIADLVISDQPDEVLVTYALGSCIAVMLYDPAARIAGMIHYMLPQSSINPEKAVQKPAMFADTGVPLLFQSMYAQGATKTNLIVRVAGGAQIYDDHGTFDIGRRNCTILRKMLWKNSVLINSEDVGGTKSRTVYLWVNDGRCVVKSPRNEELEL